MRQRCRPTSPLDKPMEPRDWRTRVVESPIRLSLPCQMRHRAIWSDRSSHASARLAWLPTQLTRVGRYRARDAGTPRPDLFLLPLPDSGTSRRTLALSFKATAHAYGMVLHAGYKQRLFSVSSSAPVVQHPNVSSDAPPLRSSARNNSS